MPRNPTIAALFAVITACAAPVAAHADTFTFVALGDAPYGKAKKVYPLYEALIDTINDADPDLVIHVGDTKTGSSKCSNKKLNAQRAYLDSFTAPTLYTPGDNEWTDCHRDKAGGYDPLERLAYIRDTYFANPARSFGQETVALTQQGADGYPENARVMHKDVLFATLHIVGSNNNYDLASKPARTEFYARNKAALAWLDSTFDAAKTADALVLALHADMFRAFDPQSAEGWQLTSGFRDIGKAIRAHAGAYEKPVLLIFGDSHEHVIFTPFTNAPNLTAVEVPGAKDMHALEITVTRTDGDVSFGIEILRNPAL